MSTRGKIFSKTNFFFKWWASSILLVVFISACGPNSNPILQVKLPPCRLEGVNVYENAINPSVLEIYKYSTLSEDTTNATPIPEDVKNQSYLGARYAALRWLESETRKWTSSQQIILNDTGTSYAQVMVTFLSPDLVQAIYLNDILRRKTPVDSIQTDVSNVLKKFGEREEMVFFVSVTSVMPDWQMEPPHSLNINANQMNMINTEGMSISPVHTDYNLNQFMNLPSSTFGYMYYPFSVRSDGMCVQVLEPAHNTKINILASNIVVDKVGGGSMAWSLNYASLLHIGTPVSTPNYATPEGSAFSPLTGEPVDLTIPQTLPQSNDQNFMREYAKFLWSQVVPPNQ